MKVSFLVTYYNQAQYVEQSLTSILSQKLDCDYEILVTDDGSSDKTQEVINDFVQKYPEKIKLFVMPREQEKNYNSILRVSAARIFLLKQATGDYFLTLDGDDWYCDDTFVQEGIDILEKDKTIAACGFLYQNWYSEENIEKIKYFKSAKRIKAGKYIRSMYLHAGACIHRRANDSEQMVTIEKTGCFDDNDILINTLNYGDLYFIPKTVYSYRQTEGSSWNSSSMLLQNIINCWGYEIECLQSRYKKDLFIRYMYCFLYLYRHKKEIPEINIGKNTVYFDYAKNNDTLILHDIFFWNELSSKEKWKFRRKVMLRVYWSIAIRRNYVKVIYRRLERIWRKV